MAAGTMATTAGMSVILYYVLKPIMLESKRIAGMPAQAPETRLEKTIALSTTIGFTLAETLGKWRPGHLAFGIAYLMRTLENLRVAGVYAGSDSIELKGPKIIAELNGLLRLLRLCRLFSEKEKPSPVKLESVGYCQEDVLFHNPKAGLLKPVFAIIRDKNLKCILLLIRGTHSIKDVLTALSGAVEPFHHSVVNDGGISNLVDGFAHRGMVAAARRIAELSTPVLQKALRKYPDYNAKIVGHSLGGGTAALLTYILRGQKEFSSTSITCVSFAPAACMTRDLAESGKHFITTVINGSDFVPTFSTASVDDLRSEITSSPWLNDVLHRAERMKVKNVYRRSKAALRSLLRPASSSTQSSNEDITEDELLEVETELQGWEEEEVVVEAEPDSAENKQASSSSDATTESHQFFPPGRIMHIVEEAEHIRIFETSRKLYSKLRLSRTMVDDHYMIKYKKMMELLIKELENNDGRKRLERIKLPASLFKQITHQ